MSNTCAQWNYVSALCQAILVLCFQAILCDDDLPPFPLREYMFGTTEALMDQRYLRTFENRALCNPSPGFRSNDDYPCCQCHNECMKRKNCCIDFLWRDYISSASNVSIDGYKEYIVLRSRLYKEVVCARITDYPVLNKNLIMVVSCPGYVPDGDRDKFECEGGPLNRAIIAPVFGGDGYVYRNGHCARCHATSSFTELDVTLDCDGFSPPEKGAPIFEALHGCKASVQSSEAKQFECFGFVRPEQTAKALARASDLCKSYDSLVYDQIGVMHKNLDCFKDWFGDTFDFRDTYQQFSIKSCPIMSLRPRFSVTISFEKNVRVRDNQSGSTVYSTFAFCNRDETYDIFTGRCTVFACGPGYVRDGNQCIFNEIDIHAKSTMEKLKQCIAVENGGLYIQKVEKNDTSTVWFMNALNLSSVDYKILPGGPQSSFSMSSEIVLLGLLDSVRSINATILLAQESLLIYQYISDIYISSTNKILSSSHLPNHQFILQTIFPESKLCAKPRRLDLSEVNISSSCSLVTARSIYNSTDYVAWFHSNASVSQEVVFYVCDGFYQHVCVGEWKLETNYTRWTNLSVTLQDHSSLEFGDYAPVQEGIKICHSQGPGKAGSWRIVVEDVEAYVTMIGIILSMVAYVWVIATFVYFSELRTNPGKCVVSLSLSLLITDVLFLCQLAVTDDSKGCKIIAVLLHYFLLSTHAWAAVITFDITHTFLDQRGAKNHNSRMLFMRFSAAAWLSPLVLVFLGVTLEETGAVQMDYGKFAGACWVRSFEGRLGLYIVPSHIVILVCFFALAVTLFKINRQQKESAAILNHRRDNVNLARIALKLVIILGIVEIIGLVQGSNSSSASVQKSLSFVQILYSFVRGFRGVFIWIFYICLNKTVWSLYKRSYKYKADDMSTSTSLRQKLTVQTETTM